jgi:hypothetical protein
VLSSLLSFWLSSPSISLSPEIRRRLRGRSEEAEAGVELVRTSLACIAGEYGYCYAGMGAGMRAVMAQAGDGRAALIGLVLVCSIESGMDQRGVVYVKTDEAMAFGRSGRG